MRKKINFIFLLLLGILLTSNNVLAQRGVVTEFATPLDPSAKPTPIYIGPAAGINIMGHNMNIKQLDLPDQPLCPDFVDAKGLGFYAGLTMEYLIGDVATSTSAIIVRALYNTYPGTVTVEGDNLPIANGDSYINTVTEHSLDVKSSAVTLEAVYKFNPIPGMGFGLVAGPTFDYHLSKKWTQKFMLVSPNNVSFEPGANPNNYRYVDNNRTILIKDDVDIENASSIRIGLKAGIQYEILLGSRFYIVPAVCYNFGITSFNSDYDWRISPLQVGLDARYALTL